MIAREHALNTHDAIFEIREMGVNVFIVVAMQEAVLKAEATTKAVVCKIVCRRVPFISLECTYRMVVKHGHQGGTASGQATPWALGGPVGGGCPF